MNLKIAPNFFEARMGVSFFILLFILAPSLLACQKMGCSGVDADSKAKKMTNLDLKWTMKVDGDRLRIDYTVTNHTKAPIILVEQLLVKTAPDAEAIVVRNADIPKTAALTRALVKTNEKVIALPLPVARMLDVSVTAKGTASTAWPLRAWRNFSTLPPLANDIEQVVLEIGYIDEPGAQLTDVALPTGTVKSPAAIGKQKLLRGEPKKLP